MARILTFGTLFTTLLFSSAQAQQGMRFVENKGQWPAPVSFRAEVSGATIWCERDAVVIDLYDAERVSSPHGDIRIDPTDAQHAQLQQHAVRLKFLSASDRTHVIGSAKLAGHHNYFIGNDPDQWAGGAKAYAAMDMFEVAPGCNAHFRSGSSGLKYDLALAPGADPSAIRFTYEGADDIQVRNGALIISTSLGILTERIPLAYQEINGERKVVVCRYVLSGNEVRIKPEAYDPGSPLVIDPTLSFATYSGSYSNNFGYSATFDAAGSLYAGSTAFGTQYPITMGAYQTTWAGGTTDIAITKYDTTGSSLVWSTYLGGSAAEMPHSLIVAPNNQLLVLGTTASTDFPITANAYDASFAGGTAFTPIGLGLSYPNGSDMVVARLSADGSALLGSTYLGGSLNDGLNSAPALKFNYADEVRGEVFLDTLGNVWITSCTQSPDMLTTPSAVQPAFGGGSHDGYIARFDPLLTQLQYASYLGGSSADAIYAGELDAQGRLFVTGGTSSTNLAPSAGAVSPAFNGGAADAFAVRISTSSSTIGALTYWGSSAYDQSYFVELDEVGDVYLFGQTAAPTGQLISSAPYNIPSGGQFITKMDPDLSTVLFSSRIGSGDGDPDISPTAFLVDVCDKIYTSGWGSNSSGLGGALTTTGLPVTSGAHQTITLGHDLYLAVFDINMNALSYATYYGGALSPEHVDGGTSRFDRRGRVYQSVCAGCQNNDDFPTSPNAWSSTNNSAGCNNGVLKFDFDAPLVIAAFTISDTVCAAAPFTFYNQSSGAAGYLWDFGDNTTSTQTSPQHAYSSPGTYVVRLTATDPASCNGTDVAQRTIVVAPAAPSITAMNDTLICGPTSSIELVATSNGSGNSYRWSTSSEFSDMLNATQFDSVAVLSPVVPGTYFVRAGAGPLCFSIDSVMIGASLVDLELTGDMEICATDTAELMLAGSDPGSTITWSPPTEILTGQGTPIVTVVPVESTTFGVEVNAPSGCSWSGMITVEVSPIVGGSVSASVDQHVVLPGTTVQLQARPVNGTSFSWSPAGLVSDPTSASPTAVVQQTTTFTVVVSDGICTREASVTVEVRDLLCDDPDIFVPNTFTPNNDGNNDVLFVRGVAVRDLEFMVFDRWGEKVFGTRDRSFGWDGTYEGKPVDPAVFVYHLTVFCIDGQRFFTKGNVTVMR